MKKILLWLLAGVMALVGIFAVNFFWFKPFSIDHFYMRVFGNYAIQSPELLTQLRLLDGLGIDYYNDDWDDASREAQAELQEQLKSDLATLREYDDNALSESQLLSKDILEWFLEQQARSAEFELYNYPVNQLFGIQNNMPSFLDGSHMVDDEDDAQDYIARLNKLPIKFEQVKKGLYAREQAGIIPPTFVVEAVIEEMTGFVAKPAQENILYVSFKDKLGKVTDLNDAKKAELLTAAENSITERVYPAYQDYIDYFTVLKSKTTNDAGVWKFPNGEQFYSVVLRGYTTTDLTADEIHQLGLSEVARIEQEMKHILSEEGYSVQGDVGLVMSQLNEEERFLYADTQEAREKILQDYQQIIDEIDQNLESYFAIRPQAGVQVKRIPEFKEKGAPGAYYDSPPLDGSRPGTFYANLYDIKATPKYSMRTLAYHEAVPGHHFQVAIQQELTDVPFFRKLIPFTAYSEGWALYAEQLAWEAGFQSDPYDNLGRLQAEMFRAVRLVVDTGLHHKRWTREEAIDYMRRKTGNTMSDVKAEIERYIVMPGQATAYKVGMLEILRLREKAQSRLGEQFDVREFHDVILKNGAVPMEILEQLVNQYIARKQAV